MKPGVFKDMTFCTYFPDCMNSYRCPRALTKEVEHDAIMWWGTDSAPIEIYAEPPHCFETAEDAQRHHEEACKYAEENADD